MKTFRELQPGDKIYYWDKGKLHEQTVHEATIETETYVRNTYWGSHTKEDTRKVLHLVAGKNRRTDVKLHYRLNCSQLFFGSMRRFACLEAALCWINEQKSYCTYRLNRLERRVNSYRKHINKYNEAVNRYGKQ